jgi:hypothetical protein
MAIFERYLNCVSRRLSGVMLAVMALVSLMGFTPAVRAQSEPAPVTFRTLGIGGNVSDVFYDRGGKPVLVTASSAGLSMPYEAPSGGRIVFYRLVPAETPEGAPHRVIVKEAHMTGTGPFLVFMGVREGAPGGVLVQVSEDSWQTHPAETIRLFNFSRRDLAVRIVIKDLVVELNSGQDRVLPYGATGQFWMQAATKETTGWVIRVSAPQVAPPKARITGIVFDELPTADRPVTHELFLVKFVDVAPTPPAP